MLDLTDNLVDGEVVPPAGVRILDGDDPYLVVAADKGTATLSDTANAISESLRLLARRRVRVRRLGRLRPQEARDHGARRLGVGQAPLPRARPRRRDRAVHRRRHRRHVGRRVRQRDAALRRRSGWSPRSTTATSSSIPTPTRPPGSPSAGGSSTCPARRGTTTTARRSPPAAASSRSTPRASRSGPRLRAALGLDDAVTALPPAELKARDPARAGRPVLERRHRHLREGVRRVARRGRRPHQRRDPRRRRATCAAASSARAATSASRSAGGSSTRAPAAASTPTPSTTRPASTAPTTRSTSRSCSASPRRPAT